MENEHKHRIKVILKSVLPVLFIGFAYLIFVRLTGLGIPCLLTLFTKGYCPGCGITRMFLALSRFDFAGAFRANALVMILLPTYLPFACARLVKYYKTGKNEPSRAEKIYAVVAVVLIFAFWIMRNMDAFSFLAPI